MCFNQRELLSMTWAKAIALHPPDRTTSKGSNSTLRQTDCSPKTANAMDKASRPRAPPRCAATTRYSSLKCNSLAFTLQLPPAGCSVWQTGLTCKPSAATTDVARAA